MQREPNIHIAVLASQQRRQQQQVGIVDPDNFVDRGRVIGRVVVQRVQILGHCVREDLVDLVVGLHLQIAHLVAVAWLAELLEVVEEGLDHVLVVQVRFCQRLVLDEDGDAVVLAQDLFDFSALLVTFWIDAWVAHPDRLKS